MSVHQVSALFFSSHQSALCARILFQAAFIRAEEMAAKAIFKDQFVTDSFEHSQHTSIIYGTGFNLECSSIAWTADNAKTKHCESNFQEENLEGIFG